MTERRDAYVRVYYSIRADERFVGIYGDDHHLATWLRLLLDADAVWPAPASMPRRARAGSVAALVAAGLVELLPEHHFRIHGLDRERNRRASSGKAGASARWSDRNANALPTHSERIPERTADAMPRRAETSKDETEQTARMADAGWDDAEHEALAWLSKHGCDVRPGNGYHVKLVTAVEHHGVNAVVGMFDRLASAGTKTGDIKGFLFGAIDALDAQSRPNLSDVNRQDRASEEERAHKVRLERTRREIDALRAVGQPSRTAP